MEVDSVEGPLPNPCSALVGHVFGFSNCNMPDNPGSLPDRSSVSLPPACFKEIANEVVDAGPKMTLDSFDVDCVNVVFDRIGRHFMGGFLYLFEDGNMIIEKYESVNASQEELEKIFTEECL